MIYAYIEKEIWLGGQTNLLNFFSLCVNRGIFYFRSSINC